MGEMGRKKHGLPRDTLTNRRSEVGPLGRTHYGRIVFAEVFFLPLVYRIAVKLYSRPIGLLYYCENSVARLLGCLLDDFSTAGRKGTRSIDDRTVEDQKNVILPLYANACLC